MQKEIKRKCKKWQEAEIIYLLKNYRHVKNRILAHNLNKPVVSITKKAKYLKIKKSKEFIDQLYSDQVKTLQEVYKIKKIDAIKKLSKARKSKMTLRDWSKSPSSARLTFRGAKSMQNSEKIWSSARLSSSSRDSVKTWPRSLTLKTTTTLSKTEPLREF